MGYLNDAARDFEERLNAFAAGDLSREDFGKWYTAQILASYRNGQGRDDTRTPAKKTRGNRAKRDD